MSRIIIICALAGILSVPAKADETLKLRQVQHANAEMRCPELERLRSDVTAVSKQLMRDPISTRCLSYHHLANTVQAIVEHARKTHEACGISAETLEQMERYRRTVARDRDKLCEERPRVLFPR